MNAAVAESAHPRAAERTAPKPTLGLPWRTLCENGLAAHFRQRANDHYFPVPDPDETAPGKIDAILGGRFEFNNEAHVVSRQMNWLENPSKDVEWHILLHKFYYAVGLGMRFRDTGERRYLDGFVDLVSSWIDQTPPGFIAADVTGRRVQNWIYAFHYFSADAGSDAFPAAFLSRFLRSIEEQVEYLCENLTPARNHRTLELYAIFLAGVALPEFERAAAWREFALAEIVRNIQTDLLPDGVHCELSTDYHHLVLKNYLCIRRLAELNGIAIPAVMDQRLVRALEFSLFVHKPDGVIPSLSDGDSRSFRDLLLQGADLYRRDDMRYVATLGVEGVPPRKRAQGFHDAGYYVLHGGWGRGARAYEDEHYLVLDCGPLGAGNHGHLDCLSFELAANGRSLVVDPGRYTYSEAGDVNWRVKFRGTAWHNTVTVDGRNQTRYEPRPVKEGTRHRPGAVRHRISGPAPDADLRRFVVLDGFGLLHGVAKSHEYPVVHDRRIVFAFGDYWVVNDTLIGTDAEHRYDQWFHLSECAQDSAVVDRRWGTVRVATPGLLIAHEDRGGVEVGVEAGQVSYRYGVSHDAPIVRVTQTAESASFASVLFPFRGETPNVMVRELNVMPDAITPQTQTANAWAMRIQVGEGRHGYTDYLFLAEVTDAEWHFGGFAFRGSFLAMRRDASGEIVELHADRGARLRDASGRIAWKGLAS